MVGDRVFFRVQPHKSPIHYGNNSKLTPHFVGPFKILEQIGLVAYCLALPPSLSHIHNLFHVSILWKYIYDESHLIDWDALQVELDKQIALEPIHILARWTLSLQGRELDQVRV